MANRDYGAGSKPKTKGKGWYDEGMGRDPVRKPSGETGNSTTKGIQLDYEKLLNQGLSSKLPRKA